MSMFQSGDATGAAPVTRVPAPATTKDLRRAGFPFRSGALCLDFVATLAKRGIADRELLGGPEELVTWLRVAGLPLARPPISEGDVVVARELREAIHAMTRALVDHEPLPVDAIDLVNEAASASPPVTLLGRDGASPVPPELASLEAILAMIARDAIDLFTGNYRQRIRACLGHDCSLFFVDRSRPGSRRWCTMAACGEKASSATYRRRHPAHPGSRRR